MSLETNKARMDGLSICALICGILSLLLCWTVFLPVPCAGFAITFALLSRGRLKMSTPALIGMVLSIFGVICSNIFIVLLIGFTMAAGGAL